ncbi:MAG: ABC transporter permease [Bacteroidota bacterium]
MKARNKNADSPRLAKWLLKSFSSYDFVSTALWDLDELFQINVETLGVRKARYIYLKEVLSIIIHLFFKGKSQYSINKFAMFKHNILISIRNFKRFKTTFFINIIGLAISMSVGILMILFLSEIYSFDDFHARKNDIYRVSTVRVQGSSGEESYLTTASLYIADQLNSQVAGIESVLMMRSEMHSTDLKTEERAISAEGFRASDTFFDIFSFKLKSGNPATALTHPNGIVLTESTALKLFSDNDPIGQSVSFDISPNSSTYMVTGVVEDPPKNSHMKFDFLLSLGNAEGQMENHEAEDANSPSATGEYYVYVLLDERARPEAVELSMANIISDHNARLDHPVRHYLQPMNSFVTSDLYSNLIGPRFPQQRVYLMIGLTLLILISACFNYSNLSLASALKRSKEVGVRKVSGADSSNVFLQFLIEAILLSFLAFFMGLGLFFFIRPEFLRIQNIALQGADMFQLNVELIHIAYFLLFTIILGILAGLLPASFFAKLTAKELIKDVSKTRFFPGLNLRRIMIVFQIAIAISLVTASVLVYNQYRFSLNFDLGYETENIINVPVKSEYIDLLENKYAGISEVVQISKSSLVIGIGGDGLSGGMTQVEDKKPNLTLIGYIDQSFLDLHEFALVAGSTFMNPLMDGGNPDYIIVNEGLVKELDLGTPDEAVGKTIGLNGSQVNILGVVKDFIEIGLSKKLFKSFAFIYPDHNDQFSILSLKFQGSNLPLFIKKLEKEYKTIDPVHPFEFRFYSDQIENNYRQQKLTYILVTGLAFLAISISMLGLLGMAVITAESKTKEISIRKVLGARLANLVLLLSRSYLISMIIAGLFAIPLTLYIVDSVVLNEFMYRDKIGWEIFSGLLVVLIVGILTVSWQILSVALQNPVDHLKTE